jgi:hypothetical protein
MPEVRDRKPHHGIDPPRVQAPMEERDGHRVLGGARGSDDGRRVKRVVAPEAPLFFCQSFEN